MANIFKKGLFLVLVAFCFSLSSGYGQIDLFTETFDEPNGSTSGVSAEGIAWSRVCPTCPNTGYFEVVNGAFENNNTDAPATWTTSPIDISACSRIELTIDYSGDPFPGGGNLESNDECNMGGPCLGDINNPNAGGCFNCWDFMDFKIAIDGTFIPVGLIGTNLTPTSTQFFYENEECAGVGSEAIIQVIAQTWAAAEFMRFDNVSLICFDDGGLTASLSGGGNLCGSNCTTVDWNISGGVPTYDLDINFTLGAINIDFTVPAVNTTGSINVCLDSSIPVPFYNAANNTLFLNENFGSLATISLTGVSDSDGCTVALSGQTIDINIVSPPSITDIPDISLCTDINGMATIDLSNFDMQVGAGNNVTWYSDPGLSTEVGPMFTTSTNTVIYAVVDDGNGCESDNIQVSIILTVSPFLNPVGNIESCDSYILPPIVGSNLIDPAYYTMPDGGGVQYDPGDIIDFNTTLYIYDISGTCSVELAFDILILPAPEIDPIFSVTECGFYQLPLITGNNVSPFAVYHDLPGGLGNTYLPGDIITTSIVLYAYDEFGVCSDEVLFTVLISQAPEIDMPTFLEACGSVLLPDYNGQNLSNNISYFTGPNGTGTSLNPGDEISSSQIVYVYDAIGNCTDQAEIAITITPGPQISTVSDTIICADYYVFPEILFSDNSGNTVISYYYDQSITQLPGDTLFNVDSIYNYIARVNYENNMACADESNFTITFSQILDAGSNDTFNVCLGSEISLMDLLQNGVNDTGEFIEITNTSAIDNDTLFTALTGGINQVHINYILANICGEDTSSFVINIVNQADAGLDITNTICEGVVINPNDYIEGDPGGSFFIEGNGTPLTEIQTVGEAGNNIDVIYIVGDGNNCPLDTSVYTFEISSTPEFNAQPIVSSCGFYLLPIIDGNGLDGSEAYYTEPNGQGIKFESGDSIKSDMKLYLFFENQFCYAEDSLIINVGLINTTFRNETLCPDEFIVVNGVTYDINLQSGSQEMKNADGCDSFIVVNLSYILPDTNLIASNLCFGESITINGTVYDETNTFGIEVLPNMASSGCDSIIKIDLSFNNASITPINEMICANDSIQINGIWYSANNPSGMDTITLGSGCDSVLDINISFISINQGLLDTTICAQDGFIFNGTLYDASNTNGEEQLLGQSSAGCDSTVVVNVNFYNVGMGLYEETFCPGEEKTIFGVLFNEANSEQEVVLSGASAQNCDSTILVSITFLDVEEGLIMESICAGSSIDIMGETYDENNTIGQFTVQNAEGCDSTVNVLVEIVSVNAILETEFLNCPNETGDIAFAVFNGLNIPSTNYSISDNNTDFSNINVGDTLFFQGTGQYIYYFQNAEMCTAEWNIVIDDIVLPELDLIETATIKKGDSYQINVSNIPANSVIVWTPNVDISCIDCTNPIVSPEVDTEYFVTVTTEDGCSLQASILIRVEESADIYLPNIFSPNEDGINDVFYISSAQEVVYNLYVYDRWGNKMFEAVNLEANNSLQGWDGSFNGRRVNPGVYVYYAEIVGVDSLLPIVLSGDVTVIK